MPKCLFQKRHYDAVAEILRAVRNQYGTGWINEKTQMGALAACGSIQDRLANLFEADNPRTKRGQGFNRQKFEEACEP
jgi:hypothetical protein